MNEEPKKSTEPGFWRSADGIRRLFDGSPDPMLVSRLDDYRFVSVNQRAIEVYGYSREEFLKMRVFDVEVEIVAEETLPDLNKIPIGEVIETVGANKRKDGSTFPVQVRFCKLDNQYMVATARDMTRQKQAKLELEKLIEAQDQELRGTELKLTEILQVAMDAIISVDDTHKIIMFNTGAQNIFGYASKEVIGQPMEILLPDFAQKNHLSMMKNFAEESTHSRKMESRSVISGRRKNGELFPAAASISKVIVDGRHTFTAFLRDVTDQKQQEDRLIAALAEADRAASLVKLGTYVWDMSEGRLTSCSDEYAHIYGRSVDQMLQLFTSNEKGFGYVHPDDQEGLISLVTEAVQNRENYSAKYRIQLPNGHIRHLRELVVLVLNDDGRVVQLLGSIQDVTEQVQIEEQLRQSQRMEAVGQLSGGIAHDFNNLLTAISGYSKLLIDGLPTGALLHHHALEIKQAGESAAKLTQQLLAFSRKQILQPQVIKLSETTERIEGLLRQLIGDHIDLNFLWDSDLESIEADPGQMEQVLVNLVVNASDAIPPAGGTINVNLTNVTLADKLSSTFFELEAGDYVVLSVSDDGGGIDEKTLQLIFEPFYTTKEVGKGTGLGLSTVHGIVKQSHGEVEVESESGKGTTFRIYLPQVESPEPQRREPERTATTSTGSETILLAEDVAMLRELFKYTLEASGYTVLLASDGHEALLVADQHQGSIDLLITDVVMPKMGGHELGQKLKLQHPNLPVLYMSGYDAEMVADQGLVDIENRFLQKPIDLGEFNEKIREILDQVTSDH